MPPVPGPIDSPPARPTDPAAAVAGAAGAPVLVGNANLRGALWMLLSAFGFACMGAIVKILGARLDSFQIVFFRAFVGVIAVLPFLARAGWHMAWPQYPVRHVWRAATGLMAMICGFYAITHLPLATATSITFAQPLFMVVIAALFLGETVRWRRWTATAVGFLGVLVMLRPDAGILELAAFAALANAFFVAASAAQVKAMPAEERELTLLFTFQALSSLALLAPAVMVWVPPTPSEWLLLGVMGLLGVASQAAIIRSYRVGADASFVAPFDYVRLIFATGFGFFLFTEVPDIWTGVGAAIIVASTLYIARRDARLGARPKTTGDTGR